MRFSSVSFANSPTMFFVRSILICLIIAATAARLSVAQQPTAEQAEFFESRVRPLLIENCFSCHSDKKQEGGLRLDSRSSILAGGDTGAVVVEGRPQESLLVEAINYRSLEMPPKNRLSDEQIQTLTEWIAQGLPWPNSNDTPLAPRQPGREISEEDRQHWAFQPIGRPSPPNDPQSDWDDSNPIDGFVLAKLQQQGLSPSAPATQRELLRRAFFDLIGLPPTPEEMARFLADDSPTAFAKVVDDLLSRPQYGERWGRHWLDLVRYAQTNGYERDDEKPYVWRYRDYVIRSFNQDKPFSQFILEQLAGDELEAVSHDSIIATGYYHLGVWDDEPDDKQQAIFDGLDDVLRTTGEAFLGLTIGCARCHDHKFDPIPQADYYRLLAIVQNIAPYGRDKLATHWKINPDAVFTPLATREQLEAWLPKRAELQAQIAELRQKTIDKPEEKEPNEKKIIEIEKELYEPPFDQALAVHELGPTPTATKILIRGSHLTPGEEVSPAFLAVLGGTPVEATPPTVPPDCTNPMRDVMQRAGVSATSGRRRALADWIIDPTNPLTSRVIVNRLWQHHFGRGIVATPNDFGHTGRPPTHPELLDWLASRLVEDGWHLKSLHRLIMLSNAYQQTSHDDRDTPDIDPDNTLLWRQNLHRLEAETLRDTMLFTSGQLNLEMGGRGFFPALSAEVLASQSKPGNGWDNSNPTQRSRRGVYVYLKRTLGVPMLEAFDAPVFDTPAAQRQSTTIAPQALILLNSDFVHEQSTAFAARILQDVGPGGDWVERAVQLALCRAATPVERQTLAAFYERRHAAILQLRRSDTSLTDPNSADADRQAIAECCRLIFNLNEFLYVD